MERVARILWNRNVAISCFKRCTSRELKRGICDHPMHRNQPKKVAQNALPVSNKASTKSCCAISLQRNIRLGQNNGNIMSFSTSSSLRQKLAKEEIKKRVDDLTDRFVEARELLGDARESLGSTYFSEDMVEAQEAVSGTLSAYEALLADLDQKQRDDVVRTIGLRMEELKAQEQAIKDLLD